MRISSGVVILSFFLWCHTMMYGQREMVATGTWQYHLPLNLGRNLALADGKVYCSAKAGLYFYEKEFNSTQQLTKQDGLNSVEISAIHYYKEMDMLFIAYSNTNIDIIQGNSIINLNDIYRKQIIGQKRINAIHFADKKAYLACSFGVVVIDLEKLEVKETYQSLGLTGEPLVVHDLCFQDSLLYLGTQEGVLYGTISPGVNLLDFNSWNRFGITDSLPDLECTSIAEFEGDVFAYFKDTSGVSTYRLSDSKWTLDQRFEQKIKNLSMEEGNRLVGTYPSGFYVLQADGSFKTIENNFSYLEKVMYDATDDVYWAANAISGLVRISSDGAVKEELRPNSPGNSAIFALENIDGKIYALRGGYDDSYTQLNAPMQVDILGSYGWTSRTYQYSPGSTLYNVQDVQVAKYNSNTGKTFYGSHGYGLIEEYAKEEYTIYNDTNSILVNVLDSGPYVRITDLAIDKNGELWIANYVEAKSSSKPSFYSVEEDGTWHSYMLPNVDGIGNPTKLRVGSNGYKWASIASKFGGGIVVFETDPDDHTVINKRHLSTGFEEGGLPDNDVRCMIEDRDGITMWVGTINGIVPFYNVSMLFDEPNPGDASASKIYIDGRPVLEDGVVSCIALDAGNRKWIGTPNGVWLFDKDVSEVIHNFTVENSPLPSNYIVDIEVNHETGEVFIATDLGLVSFRGDATTGFSECQKEVKVFPNPVEPEYSGDVAVSGLRSGADIKIIDMAGNLTYETKANGGGFSWDCKNYNGERVASGIYEIIVYGGTKSRSCVTRVAIVN